MGTLCCLLPCLFETSVTRINASGQSPPPELPNRAYKSRPDVAFHTTKTKAKTQTAGTLQMHPAPARTCHLCRPALT